MKLKKYQSVIIIFAVLFVIGGGLYANWIWKSRENVDELLQDESQGEYGTIEKYYQNVNSDKDMESEKVVEKVRMFSVETKNYEFSLKEMVVNKGEKILLDVKNLEGTHDLTIDEFNVKTAQLTQKGDGATIEFVADKKGTFEYYCSIADHRERGMTGKLIVK